MFQLILTFQLELPFDGAGAGTPARQSSGATPRASKVARSGEPRPLAKRPRSVRQKVSHSLELPLGLERGGAREADL